MSVVAVKSKKALHLVPKSSNPLTTCEHAVMLSKTVGARIFWRPGGIINWMLPGMDPAEIVEG